jgi:hypothetical protein
VTAIDPASIREAVRAILARMPGPESVGGAFLERKLDFDEMCELFDPLVEAHGVDPLVETLGPHKDDPDLAEAVFFVCWNYEHNMLAVFTEGEIVEVALQELLQFGEGRTTDTRGIPQWGWSALWQHYYDGDDHLTDEQAFRLLLELLERVPLDDKILWMIGDGPLSHARGVPEYRKRIDELARSEPKIARALELDDETTRDREQLHYILRGDGPPQLDT